MVLKRILMVIVSIWAASTLSAFGGTDPNTLYQQALQLESKGAYAQALTLYQQIINQYPADSAAGPDTAGFHVKYAAGMLAAKNGDITATKTIVDEIKSLNATPLQKPYQLFLAGLLLETAGTPQDALTLYQQVISQYPNDSASGPDNASFHAKYVAGLLASKSGNIAATKTIADEIKSLNASPPQKPYQLFLAGLLLETAGSPQDALPFYQQVVSQYPNDPAAGPDNAGFHAKYVAGVLASKKGDIAATKTIVDEIKSLNASPSQKPYQLYLAGLLLETAGLPQDALPVYQQVISQYPNDPAAGADDAGFHVKYIACILASEKGDIAATRTIVDEIKTLTATPLQKPYQLFVAAEACYLAGLKNNQNEFFRMSADLLENNVFTLEVSSPLKAEAFYMLGLNYDKLGDYPKAAEAFQNSYQADSKFQYADYCVFAQGHCYEKLLEQKLVSEVESKAMTGHMYTQLLQLYPDSKGATYARNWLKNNPNELAAEEK